MVPILREGDTIQTKDGHRGVVFYVNRRIKHYQVICRGMTTIRKISGHFPSILKLTKDNSISGHGKYPIFFTLSDMNSMILFI
jgi:hypothetical protein